MPEEVKSTIGIINLPMRTRIYEIVSRPKRGDNASCLYDLFIVIVALFSIAPAVVHTKSIGTEAQHILATIDVVTVYILSFDYLLNWMTFDIAEGKRGKWKEFLKYPFTFEAIINLLSILPTLNLLPSGFLFLRALRIVRLFRYSRQLTIIVNVFIHERKTLGSVFMLAIAYIFATALIMFTFEPETFDNFMDAVYWATITLTTIGFGDITPTSDLGHILTTLTSIFGIFIFALPAGIMTGGFLQQLRQKEEEGDEYYAVGFFEGMDFSKFCFTPNKLKRYFTENPRVRLYLLFIFVGIFLNYALCALFSYLEQPLWLDTTGTALVACALDPAAGVIVSFVDNLIIAVYQDSPQNILYFSESAVVALSYGYLFRQAKNGKLPYQNTFKTLLAIILIQSTITLFLSFSLHDGAFTTLFQNGYRDFLCEIGIEYYAASLLATIIDRTLDAFFVFGIVVLALKVMKNKNFVARKWLDDNCKAKTKVEHVTSASLLMPELKDTTNTGILSCEDEALVLSRAGLRSIANGMNKEAKKATDPEVALKCKSAAETISLLSRSNIKNEEEFKKLFLSKMNKTE